MAGITADVLIRLLGESRDLDQATKKGKSGLDKLDKSTDRADSSLGRLANRAASFAAGSVALGAITNWAYEGTKLADTADLVRKSWDKTFGESSKVLTQNILNTAHALGMADFEAQQALLTTGQLALSMGYTQEEAAGLAEGLFNAAGDVAAFRGELDQGPEVMAAFTSALKGEFDALEGVGIKLTQADVNTKALEMSMKTATSELTKAELAAATYELIMGQLSDEQGALTEAQEAGATAQNELAADMTEAQETVGQSFQEIKTLGINSFATIIDWIKTLGGWIGTSLRWWQDWADETGGAIGAVVRFVIDFILLITTADPSRFGQRVKDAVGSAVRAFESLYRIAGNVRSRISSIRMPKLSMPSWVPGFATGGTVPGPTGMPQLAVVHGGEQVLNRSQQKGAGGGGDTYITVNGGLDSGQAIAEAIVAALQTYNRTSGAIAIQTRTPGGIL